MKLEGVNGNIMSLKLTTQEQQQQQNEKVEQQHIDSEDGKNGEGAEETEPEAEELHQEEQDKDVGGKKKGARKKRSLNWEEAERGLLVEVIKPKVDFVENRNVDAISIKAKRLAWLQITKQFNLLNFRHRSLEQIQVQWRAMKNSAKREHQQKYPKGNNLEGLDMIEFMEEMQKDPIISRSQTRGAASVLINKKELLDMDDEDTPLASLPTSNSNSEDTMQGTSIALPSPPPSAESQNETMEAAPMRKKSKQQVNTVISKGTKRQRIHSTNLDGSAASATSDGQSSILPLMGFGNNATSINLNNNATTSTILSNADDKYRKQIFELMKRARLYDIDYARREHEQKLRFEQMEQDLKMDYYRQREELKMRLLREEHETRLRHSQAEHDARMRVYSINIKNFKLAGKVDNSNEEHKTINANNTEA